MSDIRFNQWLHQSGTGGVSQVASGAVGVGTTNPLADFYVRGDAQITGILTAGHIAMGSSITFGDGDRAYFGDGTDMQLYHNGTNSYIENGTNALNIKSYQIFLQNANGSEDYLKATDGYGVELYHNNNKRIESTGYGATVFGELDTTNLSISGITTVGKANQTLYSPHTTSWATRSALTLFGNYGGGLAFNDNNNNGWVQYVDSSGVNFHLKNGAVGGSLATSLKATKGGSVELYENNTKVFETASFGVNIVGGFVASGDCSIADKITHVGDLNTAIRFPAADTFTVETAGNERLRIRSDGAVGIGSAIPSAKLDIAGNVEIKDSTAQYRFLVSTNSNEAQVSSRASSGAYRNTVLLTNSFIIRNTATNSPVEKLRITSDGKVGIGTDNPAERLVVQGNGISNLAYDHDGGGFTSNSGGALVLTGYYDYSGAKLGLMVDNAGQGRIMTKTNQSLLIGTNNSKVININGSGSVGIRTDILGQIFTVKGATDIMHYPNSTIQNDRLQLGFNAPEGYIKAKNTTGSPAANIALYTTDTSGNTNKVVHVSYNSRVGINEASPDYMLHLTGTIPAICLEDTSGTHGQSIIEQNDDNLKIRCDAGNASSGYASNISLQVDGSERLKVASSGSLTNTTNSTHSQGAGTFNIKGVINQYSQGSGSGLIFDCDFGRLTGYSDDANVADGTNLSSVLAHSTTDWASSSSNTPIAVNGGTFQYRVGFGGYMEGISNGGRVSVSAGSGSPNMASTLNTASMTIESWVWYGGGGREVIASRWGTGFPYQFNMICDPNGQFHFNNSGVSCGSGNISGEHFPDKTWHHHVWQYDAVVNTVNRWYINGAFANSYDAGSSLAVSSNTGFGIFSRADDYERWRGKIAIVRIYNRALSATEIKNHFELERGRFGV